MKKRNKITSQERDKIAVWYAKKVSIRKIACRLDRSPSTVSREIKRNAFTSSKQSYYVAINAQNKSSRRKIKAGQRSSLKNDFIFSYVMEKLRSGWSPEQISGRLKKKYPNNYHKNISHESIYSYIYAKENKDKKLFEYLPRKQKRRRKKYGRKAHRSRIPDRASIHDRPKEVEDRSEFGHWEGDSIEGKGHKGGIHTEVERKTRFMMASFLKDLTANETAKKAFRMFYYLPKQARKSTTLDNGKEFVKHKLFGLPTFFADPYSSWQRGTNENSNGLIRRYLPKKTDFSCFEQWELDDMIEEINNRPRKCLEFATPQEEFVKELQSIKCCDS